MRDIQDELKRRRNEIENLQMELKILETAAALMKANPTATIKVTTTAPNQPTATMRIRGGAAKKPKQGGNQPTVDTTAWRRTTGELMADGKEHRLHDLALLVQTETPSRKLRDVRRAVHFHLTEGVKRGRFQKTKLGVYRLAP